MSSVNVNSLRFQEIVCHKNNKRCLGCGIFVGERRKFPEVAVVTDFYLGHWFCTEKWPWLNTSTNTALCGAKVVFGEFIETWRWDHHNAKEATCEACILLHWSNP